MKKERDTYIDAAKGFAMLLIVCIHTEGLEGVVLTWLAVPMFFFMSGFYDRAELHWKEWTKKNLRTLILPAVVGGGISFIYINLLHFLKEGTLANLPFDVSNPCSYDGPTWFLLALFYSKLILFIFERTINNKSAIFILSLLIGYAGMRLRLPLLLDEGMAAFPIYYCGKLFYSHIKKALRNPYAIICGGIMTIMFCSPFLSFYIVPVSKGSSYAPFYALCLAGLLSTFVFWLFVCRKYHQYLEPLKVIGLHTLGILILHSPMNHTVAAINNRLFEVGSTLWFCSEVIGYCLVVTVSLLLTVLIERNCPMLLGKNKKKLREHFKKLRSF